MRSTTTSRRWFLKLGTAAASALALFRTLRIRRAHAQGASQVFVAKSADMYAPDAARKRAAITGGLDSCIVELARASGATGGSGVGQAWEAVLGAVTATTKVAVHVTCFYADRNSLNSPQLETVQALVAGLRAMLGGTFPAANIRVFDNDMGGVNRVDAVYGKAALDALGVQHERNDCAAEPALTINGKTLYQHVYMADADVIINLARLSGHQFAPGSGPGITGCVKGIMGATSTSKSGLSGLDGVFHDSKKLWKGHRELWAALKGRVKVNIVDMVSAARHEREPFSANLGEICVGRDPCAVDGYAAKRLLEAFPGTPYAALSMPSAVAAAIAGWSTSFALVPAPLPTAPTRDGGAAADTGGSRDPGAPDAAGGRADTRPGSGEPPDASRDRQAAAPDRARSETPADARGSGDAQKDSGCGCSLGGRPSSLAVLLGGLALGFARRRARQEPGNTERPTSSRDRT